VKDVRLAPPVLIVIGRVVTLIETLGRDLVRQMQETP
jgi:siroheme synthase